MIERKICIDTDDAEDFAEYLNLVIKHPEIIDEHYSEDVGYKVIGHIRVFIEELEKLTNKKY